MTDQRYGQRASRHQDRQWVGGRYEDSVTADSVGCCGSSTNTHNTAEPQSGQGEHWEAVSNTNKNNKTDISESATNQNKEKKCMDLRKLTLRTL